MTRKKITKGKMLHGYIFNLSDNILGYLVTSLNICVSYMGLFNFNVSNYNWTSVNCIKGAIAVTVHENHVTYLGGHGSVLQYF